MAPASPSQTATVSESPCMSHTPNSDRSWRHWPSLHSSNHKSPVTTSEGRPGLWGALKLKGRNNKHSADDNGSLTKRERRKSITDIFAELGPPKKHRERSWSIGRTTTKPQDVSPSNIKNDGTGECRTRPKRRKSISDLFGSLRVHGPNHVSPKTQTHSTFPDVSGCEDESTVNTGPTSKEDTHNKFAIETATVVRVPPTLRVRFASSDEREGRPERRPEQTIITIETKHAEAERRICSASSGTSNAPTLVEEDQERVTLQPGKGETRPRTPDSYLQMLIEACESPAGEPSHEHMSPSPSPTKCHAVQPLDFLADKCTPPMDTGDCSDPGPLTAELSPLACIDQVTKNKTELKRQGRATRRQPVSWIDSEETVHRAKAHDKTLAPNGRCVGIIRNIGDNASKTQKRLQEIEVGVENSDAGFESFESLIPATNISEPIWEVGDINLYLQLTLQERNERFERLEGGFGLFYHPQPSAEAMEPSWNVCHINLYFRLILQERNERFKELEGGFDCFDPEILSTDTTNPIWSIGNVHSNFKRRCQERNERYGRLIDGIYMARTIRTTVARMTRNYHSNQSSEEDQDPTSNSRSTLPQGVRSGCDVADRQLGLVCKFGMDSDDASDSVIRGSQILKEIQNEANLYTTSIKSIPSPGLKPNLDAAVDKTLADTITLRKIYEEIVRQTDNDSSKASKSFANQEESNVGMKSRNDEELGYLETFATTPELMRAVPVDHISACCKKPKEQKAEHFAGDNIWSSMSCGNLMISEHNQVHATPQVDKKISAEGRSRKAASKTVSYEDELFYQEWVNESIDFKAFSGPQPSRLAQPPEVTLRKRNEDDAYHPRDIIDDILQDSRALRTFGGCASFSNFKAGGTSISSRMSNLARRRLVSTATVRIKFPTTTLSTPQIQTFESRSEAIAALYAYRLSQLSNFVIYDPSERIFYAQDADYTPPSSAMLEEKHQELVWLPLQPNGLPHAAESKSNNQEDEQLFSSAESKMENGLVTGEVEETVSVCPLSAVQDGLVSDATISSSDSGIENEDLANVRSPVERTTDLVDSISDDSANEGRDEQWTLSDEEYVVEVDPEMALEYLGSDYGGSAFSTPKLEKGTLLYPRILFDGVDSFYESDDPNALRRTKTWPQLGREFKARRTGPFPRSKYSLLKDNSDAYSSDATFESSSSGIDSDSDFSTWSWQVKDPYCPVRNDPSRLNEWSETGERNLGRNPSYDNLLPTTEHVEDIACDLNESTLARKLEEPGVLASRTPNNTGDTEHVADVDRGPELGIHVTCDHLQCHMGDGEVSSRPEVNESWSSWIEAELLQRSLYQTLPNLPRRDAEVSRESKSTNSSQDTSSLSSESRNLLQPKRLNQLQQDGPLNPTSDSKSTKQRSSSVTSFAAGFPFTAFSKHMLEESGQSVEISSDCNQNEHTLGEHQRTVGSSLKSKGSEKGLATTSQPEPHSSTSQEVKDCDPISHTPAANFTRPHSPQAELCREFAGKQRMSVVHDEVAEKSDLLETANIGPVQAESAITPESLNIRLVGRAARQSQLAKTSKVGALIDVYKAHGVMPQTMKPALHRTQNSPKVDRQVSYRPGSPAPTGTPPKMIYGPCGSVRARTIGASNDSAPARRKPTPASVSGDIDTESDSAFGEELGRVEKHDEEVAEGKISG